MSVERVQFGQQDRGGLLLGLGVSSILALGVAAGALLVGLVGGGVRGMGLGAALAAPLVAAALVRVQGQRAIEWLPPAISWGLRRQRGQHHYLVGERAQAVGTLVLPGRGARLRLRVGPSGSAVVEDPARGTLTVAARVSHRPFALAQASDKEDRVEGWGGVLAQLGTCRGLVSLQVQERTLPESPDALAQYFAANGVPGNPAAEGYAQVLAQAGPAAERHESYLAWTWSRRDLDRDIRRAGGGERGLGAVLGQQVAWAEKVLSGAGIGVAAWLSPQELSWVLHSAYDPGEGTDDHHGAPEAAGPEALAESWDRLRADGGWHAVYRVAEWPRLAAGADVLSPLILSARLRRSFSLLVEPVSIAKAEREIRSAKAEHHSEQATKARIGQVHSQRDDAALADVERREAELVAGHGELRYLGLVSVTAASSGDLDEACATIEMAARRSQLELRRLYGQQHQGFLAAALPLGFQVMRGTKR